MVAGRVSSHSASIAVSSLSTWPGVSYQPLIFSVLGRLTWCFSPFLGGVATERVALLPRIDLSLGGADAVLF